MLVKDALLFLRMVSLIGRRSLGLPFIPLQSAHVAQIAKEKEGDLFMQGENKTLPPTLQYSLSPDRSHAIHALVINVQRHHPTL